MKILSITLAVVAPQIRAFSSASASIIRSSSNSVPSLSVRSCSSSSDNMTQSQSAHDLLTSGDGKLSLHYFSIEGVGEQVRIALSMAGVPFEDIRIPFSEWQTKKPTTKYGQLPEMILPSGQLITESMAMLRLAGEADPEGKLYPVTDVGKRLRIEEVLGLTADLARAWRPAIYIG